MNRQLHLLHHDSKSYRRISEEAKAVGRRGIAQARAALSDARTAPERPPQELPRAAAQSHSNMRAQQRRTAA